MLYVLLAATGMRVGEALGMEPRWEQDEEQQYNPNKKGRCRISTVSSDRFGDDDLTQ